MLVRFDLKAPMEVMFINKTGIKFLDYEKSLVGQRIDTLMP